MRFSPKSSLVPLLACVCIQVNATELATDISFKFGLRMQPTYYFSNADIVSERDQHDFRMRRARFKVDARMSDWARGVIQAGQTEDDDGSFSDARIVDAYIHLTPTPNINIYAGQLLSPTARQNVTSSGALMTFDNPGIASKALAWGTRSRAKFSNITLKDTDSGLRSSVGTRDIGVLFLADHSLNNHLHYKYAVGFFEGATSAQSERIVLRGQVNWGSAEKGRIMKSTYFGKKQTLSLGVSVDQQRAVAVDVDGEHVDYQFSNVDLFLEQPIGSAAFTFETAVYILDLGDADVLYNPLANNGPTPIPGASARHSQGDGFYLQSGLTFGQWQPWLGFEQWHSDAADDSGSYDSFRLGVTYIIDDHKANIKIGIEQVNTAQAQSNRFGSSDNITALAAGLFLTF